MAPNSLSKYALEAACEDKTKYNGQDEGVCPGQYIVEHDTPSVRHTFETATHRGLDYVNHAEHGEAEEAENGGGEVVGCHSGDETWNPSADKLVNHHRAGVFPPIPFHDFGCPGSDHGGGHHQQKCYPEEGVDAYEK